MNDAARYADGGQPPALPFDLKVLLLYGVARHRVVIVLLAVVGASLGLLSGASKPNVYTSMAKLRYQPSARQMLSTESAFGITDPDPWSRRRGAPGIEDELQLLQDPTIYERVVEKIGAREILRVDDPSKGSKNAGLFGGMMHQLQGFMIRAKGLDDPCPGGEGPLCKQAAVGTLMRNTRIRAIDDTSLLQVTYTSTSSQRAQRILEALNDAFIEHHLYVYGAGGMVDEVKEQYQVVLSELQEQEKGYLEYQQQCGFYDIDGDFRTTIEQIRVREDNIRRLEAQGAQLLTYVESLEEQLNGSEAGALGGKALDENWKAQVNARNEALATIADLEARRDLSAIQQRQLERAREEFATASKLVEELPMYTNDPYAAAIAAEQNPVIAEARLELTKSRANLQAVASEIEVERDQLDELKERLTRIRECSSQHTFFKLGIDETEQKLARLASQLPELETLAVLDQEGRSNLSVFRAPRLPLGKDGPNRTKPIGLGLFGGLGLGIGLAALRQLLERRVRYRETVENDLGLKVLCVVPEVRGLADGRSVA